MSYPGFGAGSTRNVDLTRTETDLSINIRKATSIGKQGQTSVYVDRVLIRPRNRGNGSQAQTCSQLYRIYLGPQVLLVLLGWHESAACDGR